MNKLQIKRCIEENICVNCGNVVTENLDENLRKWFKDKWVNIGKKKKGGGHPPCGTSGKKPLVCRKNKKNQLLQEKEQHKTKLVGVELHQ